jgi:hypothetical protein
MQDTGSDKVKFLSGNDGIRRPVIRYILGIAPGIIKTFLYLGLTYLALFTGAQTCQGQGCAYYLFRGHCSGNAWCNAQYTDEYSSSSTCADKPYSDVQNYCWGLTPSCSAASTACTCVPSVTDTVTVSGSVACAVTGVGGWCSGGATLNLSATDSAGHPITISGTIGGNGFNCGTTNPCSQTLPEGQGNITYGATCTGGQSAGPYSDTWKLDLTPPSIDSGILSGGTLGTGGLVSGRTGNAYLHRFG